MRHAPLSSSKLPWATLLAFVLQAALLVSATSTDGTMNSRGTDDDNLQIGADMPRRDWNRNLNLLNKRGWGDLHGGWGVKRSEPSWLEQNAYSTPPIVQKRAWKNFQSGWGKRLAPDNEDFTMQEIASLLERNDHQSIPVESDFDDHEEEKRSNWAKFSDGWGKRNKWESFRGAWGKREPAWVNLKGLWGKRSNLDSYVINK
ncbi:unnamed protein product [Psylliodes chrysocephalus]|uniref:Uncharacterized protein n=1 Tax=Psylliodes chrysocephalus TaxID=3402493 RepID=A0A9P0D6Z9_9CUCU|nr:unnamed protein product [Psylliodes chrysocephala]